VADAVAPGFRERVIAAYLASLPDDGTPPA